jgi:hypothetical protein
MSGSSAKRATLAAWGRGRSHDHFAFGDGFGNLQAPNFPEGRFALSLLGEILFQGGPERLQACFADLEKFYPIELFCASVGEYVTADWIRKSPLFRINGQNANKESHTRFPQVWLI